MQANQTKQCCNSPQKVERDYYTECVNCECCCANAGQDDGGKTCWRHHDCRDGSCTHTDGDE